MTTQVRSQSRGLRMSLLALTASASVVGGMFVSVAPAYSADGIGDQPGQCVTASEEGASIIASSVVATGVPLHLEGSGWGPSSEGALGFVMARKSALMTRSSHRGFRPRLHVIGLHGRLHKLVQTALSRLILTCRLRGRLGRSIRS